MIPANVEVVSWYSFLLRELARPYRSAMHGLRIDGIHWVEGKSVPYPSAQAMASTNTGSSAHLSLASMIVTTRTLCCASHGISAPQENVPSLA